MPLDIGWHSLIRKCLSIFPRLVPLVCARSVWHNKSTLRLRRRRLKFTLGLVRIYGDKRVWISMPREQGDGILVISQLSFRRFLSYQFKFQYYTFLSFRPRRNEKRPVIRTG